MSVKRSVELQDLTPRDFGLRQSFKLVRSKVNSFDQFGAYLRLFAVVIHPATSAAPSTAQSIRYVHAGLSLKLPGAYAVDLNHDAFYALGLETRGEQKSALHGDEVRCTAAFCVIFL
ncbi:hypothetical protein PILCRDRAFT_6432 [Piloderma croceum F 1598]|uniref:Uncharacterized protein n=1 Tax=Piloderma croceum (strain F 1598) TaxID=765440 RepID=A0A0C3G0H2_PILCF|nr:hypothetical protein PILCRDRAFT_6432 [Piloderma croceum F 1598]